MKKIYSSIAYVMLILSVGLAFYFGNFSNTEIASATNNNSNSDSCDQQTTYTKSGDFDDSRIDINFTSFQGDSNRRVIIDPESGYELVSIGVDWTGSDANEATPSIGNGTQTITYDAPNNETIDNVTVTVKKVCPKVNICHHTSSQTNPIEAIRVNDDAFDGQGSNDHTQHGDFLYFGPVNPQNQQPLKPEGDEWCEDNNPNNTPTPTNTPSATPTPTVTPTITPYVTPTTTPYITPTVTPTVTPYATPTPEGGIDCENNPQAEVCIECPGQGTCEVVIGTPTPTAVPTETPSITPTPTQGGQGGTSSNSNSSSNNSASNNAAIAATSFANTGAFVNSLSNIMLTLGIAATGISAALYGKKKKSAQK